MKIPYLITLLSLLTSCAVYKQQFDCPPVQGMRCLSLIEIEQMVVETEEGPDIFGISKNERDPCCRR